MVTTIFMFILLVAGVACFFVKRPEFAFIKAMGAKASSTSSSTGYGDRWRADDEPVEKVVPAKRKTLAAFSWMPLGLLALVAIFAMTAIIPAKTIGVPTTFGKPSERTFGAGLHFIAPWQEVTQIDGTKQVDTFEKETCIPVRIGDGSQSCMETTIRWRAVPANANIIYADYRSEDPIQGLRKDVVTTQFQAAAQAVMGEYNPIANLEVVEGSNADAASALNFAPDYDEVATSLFDQMTERVEEDNLVDILSVSVSYVSLSKSTQKKLDDFIAEVGNTRIAAQKRSTATEEAAANRELAASVSNNPGVLQSKCLDIIASGIEAGYEFPAGYTCLGGDSSVVIPSAPSKSDK